MFTKLERERYNQQRESACKRLNITKNQYNWLRRARNNLCKVYTDSCNGLLAESDYEVLTQSIEDNIFEYLVKQGLNTKENKMYNYFQTDPRGATIYLDRVEIPANNYTQAVCIY